MLELLLFSFLCLVFLILNMCNFSFCFLTSKLMIPFYTYLHFLTNLGLISISILFCLCSSPNTLLPILVKIVQNLAISYK